MRNSSNNRLTKFVLDKSQSRIRYFIIASASPVGLRCRVSIVTSTTHYISNVTTRENHKTSQACDWIRAVTILLFTPRESAIQDWNCPCNYVLASRRTYAHCMWRNATRPHAYPRTAYTASRIRENRRLRRRAQWTTPPPLILRRVVVGVNCVWSSSAYK